MDALLNSAQQAGPFLSLLVLLSIFWLDRRLRRIETSHSKLTGMVELALEHHRHGQTKRNP